MAARRVANPPARRAAGPAGTAADAVTEREVRRPGRRSRLPAADPDRGGLPGAAAGGVAADQRLRHPDRLPHLRLPGAWGLPVAALRGERAARVMGGAPRPLRRHESVRPHPRRMGHGTVDAPADGVRAVRRVHWRHTRKLATERGVDDTNETEVAKVLDDLLTRAQAGPVDKATDRVAARTRVAATAHRPPAQAEPAEPAAAEPDGPMATVIPFGVFDADAAAA